MLRMVIFDFDGVIVDSEKAHFQTFRQTIQQEGIEIDWDQYLQKYLGYTDRECIMQILCDNGLKPTPAHLDQLCQIKQESFARYLTEHCLMIPGIRDLLENLKSHQIVCSICSGAIASEIHFMLEQMNLKDYFSLIVAADDVSRGKPDPEGYSLCVSGINSAPNVLPTSHESNCVKPELPILPRQCVAIEDSIWGIRAAQSAGIPCLAVATNYPSDQLHEADKVVNDLGRVDIRLLQKLI